MTQHAQYFAAQGCKPIGRANPSRSPDKKNHHHGNYHSLVGWWFGTCFIFHSVGNVIIPPDFHIFRRCRSTTNQFILGDPPNSSTRADSSGVVPRLSPSSVRALSNSLPQTQIEVIKLDASWRKS